MRSGSDSVQPRATLTNVANAGTLTHALHPFVCTFGQVKRNNRRIGELVCRLPYSRLTAGWRLTSGRPRAEKRYTKEEDDDDDDDEEDEEGRGIHL